MNNVITKQEFLNRKIDKLFMMYTYSKIDKEILQNSLKRLGINPSTVKEAINTLEN